MDDIEFSSGEVKLLIEAVLLYQKAYESFFCDPLPAELVKVKEKLGLIWNGRIWSGNVEPWFLDPETELGPPG